jgi:hypothetical protein
LSTFIAQYGLTLRQDLLEDDDTQIGALNKLMEENRVENKKLFGTFERLSPSRNANEEIVNAVTPKSTSTPNPTVDDFKKILAGLSPGALKENLFGLEGEIIVVDAGRPQPRATSRGPIRRSRTRKTTRSASPLKSTAKNTETSEGTKSKAQGLFVQNGTSVEETVPKTKSMAPVAPFALMRPDQAPVADMHTTQQPEPSSAVKEPASFQSPPNEDTAPQSAGIQPDRFNGHLDYITSGLREVLNTQRLYDLARPDQVGLAQDLQAVFDTTLRHLETDIAWSFMKHGVHILKH